jgi:hypothetical protein
LAAGKPISVYISTTGTYVFPKAALAYSTTYYWYVVAKNASGSAASDTYHFTTRADTVIYPAAAATNVQRLVSEVDWPPYTGATYYYLWVSADGGKTYVQSPKLTTSGYFDPKLAMAGSTTYYWYFTAYNSTGSLLYTLKPTTFTTGK